MLSVAKPDYKETIEKENALNSDIRHVLHKNFLRNVKEVSPFANRFKGVTEYETARNIWNFLKRGINYKKDESGFQDIRLGRRFFTDKTGDCKSYAINAISLFRAIYPGAPVAFKFTAYNKGKRVPSHVYAIVKDSSGREIIIDGCWNKFDSEKNFTFTLPIKFMTVRTLSGIEPGAKNFGVLYDAMPMEQRQAIKKAMEQRTKLALLKAMHESGKLSTEKTIAGIMEIEDEMLNGIGKLSKEERKKRRKARTKKFLKGLKAFGRGLAFISLAPIRGAFLALLAMNLNGMTSNIKLIHDFKDQSGWKKLMEFWKNVGGIPKLFKKAMITGTKHKPLWFSKKSKARFNERMERLKKEGKLNGVTLDGCYDGGLCVADYMNGIFNPAVVPAVLAMGASLLAGILPIVMKLVKGHPQAQAAAEEAATTVVEETKAGNTYQKAFDNNEGIQPGQAPDPVQIQPENAPEGEEAPADAEPEGQSGVDISGNMDWYKNLISDETENPLGKMDADTQNDLFGSLGKIFTVGTEFVGNVVTRKAKKNKKVAAALQGGEDYYAAKLSKDAGFPTWRQTDRGYRKGGGGFKLTTPVIVGGVAVLGLGLFIALKK